MTKRKEPEIRKAEIEKAAEELFLTQGYEATTVEHILQRTGLSKGGFYHHFNSKEEVLLRILDNITEESVLVAQNIADRQDLSALQKLAGLFKQQTEFKVPKAEIIRAFYKEHGGNPQFHKYSIRMWEHYLPIVTQIVRQGNTEGSMSVTYPEESVRLFLGTIASLADIYDVTDENSAREGEIEDVADRYIKALEEILTRALGISDTKIQILGRNLLDKFL